MEKQELILTVGLPGSGKTTWTNEFIKNHPDYVNVNLDDIRVMLFTPNLKWTKAKEKLAQKVFRSAIDHAVESGYSVILSNTNLDPKKNEAWRLYAVAQNLQYKEELFTHVPLGLCLERDRSRTAKVGQRVIEGMYRRYRDIWWPAPVYNPELRNVYLVDLDGTLAVMSNRSPYDWTKVGDDSINLDMMTLINAILNSWVYPDIIIVSGRDSVCRTETEDWLAEHQITYDELLMRDEGDNRPDYVIKQELYYKHIFGKYNVLGVFDDRNQTVYTWRHLGLTCFQVNYGEF